MPGFFEPVRNLRHRGPTRSRGAFNPHVDLIAERRKVGQKRLSAILQRPALRLRIAVGSDHDDRDVRSRRPRLGQQLKAAHPRHIDVRQDQDERPVACIVNALKCQGADWAKSMVNLPARRSCRNCCRNSTSINPQVMTDGCPIRLDRGG
jgi:hypothetical protein